MPYSKNPHLPKVRMEAVRLVKYRHWSMRQAARHFGVEPSTVSRWCHHPTGTGWHYIPTRSSRPRHHPNELPPEIVSAIIAYRVQYRRCAEVIHHLLKRDGIEVGLSSVKRTLKRVGFSRYSQWKKWHQYPPRPLPDKPGILVQIDTVVDGPPDDRLYLYTGLDVCSRWAFARPVVRANTHESWWFVSEARPNLPFVIQTLQSDHGAEFSRWFTKQCLSQGLEHRHSRVRRPTDNGHLERFNRTIQEECLARTTRSLAGWLKAIPEYLRYYNIERPHLGLQMQTPRQMLRSY